jgi:sterol desaturase/sphingolipid hydroxylase (fatty acid hydroxylase superfamily)
VSLQSIVDASFLESQIRWLVGVVAQNTLTLGGPLSLASLSRAFMIACIVTVYKRRAKRPNVRPKALVRVLLPGKMFLSRSARADYGFAVFNLLVSGLMLAWAILSLGEVSRVTAGVLTFVAGTRESSVISPITASILITVALFLAFELGYWINHWLSHTVPFMWQFHRVHHEAEVLTPVTNLRVHPVASFFYYNIVALSTGLAHGTTSSGHR